MIDEEDTRPTRPLRARRPVHEKEPAAVVVDATGAQVRRLRGRWRDCEAPWDDWFARARAAGVDEELAALGRAVMRAADQRGWSAALQVECGWQDDGAEMLAITRGEPRAARARWWWLLATDGCRAFGNRE